MIFRRVLLVLSFMFLLQGRADHVSAQVVDEPIHAREVWRTELQSAEDLTINYADITDMQISPNQDLLLVLRYDTLFILDATNGDLLTQYALNYLSSAARWSPNGAQIAILRPGVGVQIIDRTDDSSILLEDPSSALNRLWFVGEDRVIVYQNTNGGIKPATINITTETTEGFPFASDRLYVDQDGTVWALVTGEVVRYDPATLAQSIFDLNRLPLQVSPDGMWGFFREEMTATERYDFTTASLMPIDWGFPVEYVSLLGWSADSRYFSVDLGKRVETGTEDVLQIWDVNTMQVSFEVSNFSSPLNYTHLEWRDGRVLVPNGINGQPCEITGCKTQALVVDVSTGEVTHVLQGHQKTVNYALWSADGTRVVTASEDGTVRLWDLTQEADYPGCDPSNQFLPGTLVWFALRDGGLFGYAAPGDEEAVTSLNNNRPYVVHDGPRCIDGVDWYQVTPQLLESDGDMLLSEVRYYWLPVQPGEMMRSDD